MSAAALMARKTIVECARMRERWPLSHFSGGAFSTVDVVGARGTQLTRIKNDGSITGAYSDAVNGQHGLTGR